MTRRPQDRDVFVVALVSLAATGLFAIAVVLSQLGRVVAW